MPAGNALASSTIFALTSVSTVSAFAPGAWKIAIPAAGLPFMVKAWP